MKRTIGLLLLAFIVGCSGESSTGGPDAPAAGEATAAPQYTLTVVNADGSVETRPLDPEQEKRDVAAREGQPPAAQLGGTKGAEDVASTSEALGVTCSASAVVLYDKANGWLGGANKICISGTKGWVQFCGSGDPLLSVWCKNVRSIWPGDAEGTLDDLDRFAPPCAVHYWWSGRNDPHNPPGTYNNRQNVNPTDQTIHIGDGVCNDWSPGGVCSPAGHGACTAGGPLPTACHSCVAPVCAGDPYCCSTAWDSICISEAQAKYAAGSCNNPCGL